MKGVKITSETGRLRRVLLHRPGGELLNMTPADAASLLFDDIPYLKDAQKEHDAFAALLRANGVQVVYLEDLMTDVLRANPDMVDTFIYQWLREGDVHTSRWQNRLHDYLRSSFSGKELVLKTMEGVTLREVGGPQKGTLADMTAAADELVVAPMPNLYFTRDPAAVIGRQVCVNAMHFPTRRRETIYMDYITRFHPDFSGVGRCYDRDSQFSLEGGDILVLSDRLVAVGLSQRTSADGIEQLAASLFGQPDGTIATVLAITLPKQRAFMHLDTVLTQLDVGKFAIHAQALQGLKAYALTPGHGQVRIKELSGRLDTILAGQLGLDHVELIVCGGGDEIAAQREQWNDASNALCVAPGKVVVYQRNEVTNQLLRQHGLQVLEIPSSELSRGRGGPRCMSMPLIRD